jgi:hypothetical protein
MAASLLENRATRRSFLAKLCDPGGNFVHTAFVWLFTVPKRPKNEGFFDFFGV